MTDIREGHTIMGKKIREYSLLCAGILVWGYITCIYGWRALLWVAQQTVPEPWQSTVLGLLLVGLWFLCVVPAGCGAIWGLCVTPAPARPVRRVTYTVTLEEEGVHADEWRASASARDTRYRLHR